MSKNTACSESSKFIEQAEKLLKALHEGAKKHGIQSFFYGYVRTSPGDIYNKVDHIIAENEITYLDGLLIRDNIEQHLLDGGEEND